MGKNPEKTSWRNSCSDFEKEPGSFHKKIPGSFCEGLLEEILEGIQGMLSKGMLGDISGGISTGTSEEVFDNRNL